MPQGQKGQRNPALVRNLTSDFPTLNRYYLDGARLLSAVLATHAHGGGQLMYGWMADSRQNYGRGATTLWTELNVNPADYEATQYGGPYANLNGINEALYIPDAGWQEALTNNMFVWHWANPRTLPGVGGAEVIASKYDINGNQRSWQLIVFNNAGTTTAVFSCSSLGTGASAISANSTLALSADTWYFFAGFFEANNIVRVYAGAQDDTELTVTDTAGVPPANLFNTTAPLAIGTSFNNALTLYNPLSGYIGVGAARFNTPSTYIDSYATLLWAMTKEFYR